MRNLIRRLWPMPGDVASRKGRHRGNPALVARRPVEHQGATENWSPKAAFLGADAQGEPEETAEEATLREAAEIVDHWAAEEQRIADEVRGWFDELPSIKDDPIAAQLLAEAREREARKASVEVADHAAQPTGEYPIVRELVTA